MSCPCRECSDRKQLCHGSCERYKGWKKSLEAMAAARRADDEHYRPLHGDAKKAWMAKVKGR